MLRSFTVVGLLFAMLAATILPAASPAGSPPQAMPPHPRVVEKLEQGQARLPAYMTDPSLARRMGIDAAGPAPARAPLTGSIRALAVLVDFSDKVHTVTASFFDTLLFASPVTGRGSVRDYFHEISYGAIDIVTVTLPSSVGWVRAPQTLEYYTNSGFCIEGAYPRNCQKLAEDVVDAVNGVVDFAQYDNNNDGLTEPVMLVHAGRGAEYTSSVADIWSHSWSLYNARNYDGKFITSYVIMPEYWLTVSSATSDMTIGVFAHEMGHGFWDLPDLYDRDSSSAGIGRWSLMANGSWNGPAGLGESPAWPDAWSRVRMGVASPNSITSSVTGQSFPRAHDNPVSVFKVASLALEDQEYFLLENRQRVANSYDQYLPGDGLLVWHGDEAMNTYSLQNDRECELQPSYLCSDTQHFLVALVQADGLLEMEKKIDYGDSGDPFPGASGKTSWNMATNPDSSSWYGSTPVDTCIGLANVSASAATMTADVQTCGVPAGLSAAAVTPGQIQLSWTDTSSTETGFSIERSPDGVAGWAHLATTAANATSYTNTGLACNTPYFYRVRAVGSSYSAYSNTAGATTIVCPPAAPTNLSLSAVSQTRIDLSWTDNASNETNYLVQRSLSGSGGWSDVALLGPNLNSYADTGLACGTTYYYKVLAQNAGGPASVRPAHTQTHVCSPAAPGGLAVSPVSQTQVDLTWSDNSGNEDGFKIERSPDGSTGWSEIASVTAGVTTYANSGLSCGTTYYYRVRAYNAGGHSAYSDPAHTTTPVCLPQAPNNLTATAVSQTRIDLAWTDNSSNEDGFKIERSPDGSTGWSEIASVSASVTAFANSSLSCGTTYYYRVRAYNAGGHSTYSDPAHAATVVCIPAAPSGLAASPVSQTRVDLTWSDNSSNESGFKIERSPDGSTGWSEIASVSAGVAAYANSGLSCGTTYYYRVRAYNAGGHSAYSDPAHAATLVCLPQTPGDLTATAVSQTRIDLAWTDNSSNEDGFKIERSPDGSTGWSQVASVSAGVITYSDTGLTCGTTYYYRVAAYNASGASGYSSPASAVTPACPQFLAPSDLTATAVSQTGIELTWTDNTGDEAGFRVERSPDGAGGWAEVGSVGANVTVFTDSGLSGGATYYYRVRAYKAGTESGYCAPASATTFFYAIYLPALFQ
jgi:M6 family metalloprotease-like protein